MLRIILKSIQLIPVLLFQPSKAHLFIKESEKNEYICVISMILFFSCIGTFFAVLLPFNNLIEKFKLIVAFVSLSTIVFYSSGIIIFAFPTAFFFADGSAVAVVSASAGAFAGEFLGGSAFASAGALIFAFVVAVIGPVAGAVAVTVIDLRINDSHLLIAPLSFLISYLLCSQYKFVRLKYYFRSVFNYKENIIHHQYSSIQKMSPFWCTIISILIYVPIYLNFKPESHVKLTILSIGFLIMPALILHLPNYLLCLPIWYYQQKQLKRLIKSSRQYEILSYYEKTILFKNEMLFFQLPGLQTVFSDIAKNKQLGIEEAVKKIDHLYRFTFQQKQARKALMVLGQDQKIAHNFIHCLMHQGSFNLLESLAKGNKLAESYLILFDKSDEIRNQDNDFVISLLVSKFSLFFRKQAAKNVPEELKERIYYVCQEFSKQKDIQLTHEIIQTFDMAHKILTSQRLEEFISHCLIFPDLPDSLNYFSSLKTIFSNLFNISQTLIKTNTIERFETKRSIMNEQRQRLIDLSKSISNTFYKPFDNIWKTVLLHGTELIQQEIQLIQGTAVLEIDLTNEHIFTSSQPTTLYFEMNNKGQEYASDISIIINTDEMPLEFLQKDHSDITILESQTSREVSFPVIAKQVGEFNLKGKLIYSDKSAKNKEQPFSFTVIVSQTKKEFSPINNPYVAGQALGGKSNHLYQGRQDAFDFLDQHILINDTQHTIVCHGLRRTGKTSLLYRILEQGFTDPRLIPIYLDMQGINTEKDLFADIADKMNDALLLDDGPQINDFGDFKRYIKKIQSDKIMVVLLDEFEELQSRVKDGLMKPNVFSNIRHLMQHESKLAFVFCGTHQLEEMAADYWSIFFNTALYLKINFLSMEHTIKLITEPVGSQLKYDDLAIQQICKLTNGQPFLTQLICWTIVNDLNNHKKRNFATINDVDHAVDYIIEQGMDHFSQHIWDEITPLEHMILSAISQELINKNLNSIDPQTIYDRIAKFIGKATKKQYVESLDRLVDMDVLWFKDTRYKYLVNMFRYWVYKRHPLEKVRGEIE
jgi:hypothetical protein